MLLAAAPLLAPTDSAEGQNFTGMAFGYVILRAATIDAAEHFGLDKSLETLEVDKLANVVVFNYNPSEDIYKPDQLSFVMKNGRLYERKTMNEASSVRRTSQSFYFEK